jgi:hypothetical protein
LNALEKADRAKELLENLAFREVQAEIRSELIAAIEAVPVTDFERMQEMVLALQVHNRHKKKLEKWIADGKVEQSKLNDLNYRERIREVWDRSRSFITG